MKTILSPDAPAPVGAYSQAIQHEGLVYLSGALALDPTTRKLVGETIEQQTELTLANLLAVLTAAGSSFAGLLRVSVYLTDIGEFSRFNAVYERTLQGARPARTTVQVAALPLGAKIEIDAIAAVGSRG